jgi:hypothetical protein
MRSNFGLLIVLGVGIGIGSAERPPDAPTHEVVSAAGHDISGHPAACSIIDQREMGRILGAAVGPPARAERGGSTICTYTADGGAAFPYAKVTIDRRGGAAAMSGIKLAESWMDKDAGFSLADRIEGVGDEASMTIGGVMNVRQGPTVITIDLGLQPNAREKGTAIAKAILR